MTKVKLTNGIIVNASAVELVNGILKISTTESTVEELAELFSNKENTNLITLMTESEKETGFKTGFTSFAGINYSEDGTKTIEMFQPVDITEARIANAEGAANQASAATETLASEITDTQLAVAELAEIVAGGAE